MLIRYNPILFNNWKKGREALSNHAILKYHMQAECKMKAFIGTYTGVQKRIDHSMSLECAQQVDRNRQFLKSIHV